MENKLIIGLPTNGNLDYRFASSLMGLQLTPETRVIWQVRSMIDTARNNLVIEALKTIDYTHVLMIDDDHVFEPDVAMRLLAHDVDIVGALAFKRRPDYTPCVYCKKEDGKFYPVLPEIFQEVDILGTGMMLIKMEVLQKLQFPYFETYYTKDDEHKHFSVDFDFCMKAKKAGFKIFVDPSVEIKHIGDPEIVSKSTFLKYHQILEQQNK